MKSPDDAPVGTTGVLGRRHGDAPPLPSRLRSDGKFEPSAIPRTVERLIHACSHFPIRRTYLGITANTTIATMTIAITPC